VSLNLIKLSDLNFPTLNNSGGCFVQGKQVLGPKKCPLAHMSRDKRGEPAALSCMQGPYCGSTRRVERDEARLQHSSATQLLCEGLSPCGSLQVPRLYGLCHAMAASLVKHASQA